MAKGKQAKTASKNDPTQRGSKAKEKFDSNGQLIIPKLFDGTFLKKGAYIAGASDGTGEFLRDVNGNPIPWSKLD